MIRMHMNESPYDFPFTAKLRVMARALFVPWNRYPEESAREAVDALSLYTGQKRNNLLLGNGSNELIRLAFLAWGETGKRVLMVSPGFVTYEKEASRSGCETVRVPLGKDLSFDREAFLAHVKRADLVVLISPGNPSGELLNRDFLEEAVKACPGKVLIDEAYGEFAGLSAVTLIDRYENVVILRTLSKAFGLAGARIGYALGSLKCMEELKRVALPYSPGIFPLMLLREALKRKRVMEKRVMKLRSERARLIVRLQKSPIVDVVPGEANFILLQGMSRERAQALREALNRERIVPRLYQDETFASRLRITVGRPRDNSRFLRAVEKVERRFS